VPWFIVHIQPPADCRVHSGADVHSGAELIAVEFDSMARIVRDALIRLA